MQTKRECFCYWNLCWGFLKGRRFNWNGWRNLRELNLNGPFKATSSWKLRRIWQQTCTELLPFSDLRSLDSDSDKTLSSCLDERRTADWISMSQEMKRVFLESCFFDICSHVVPGTSLCNLHNMRSELCAAEQLLLTETIGSKWRLSCVFFCRPAFNVAQI